MVQNKTIYNRIIRCNLCDIELAPEARNDHRKLHNLTWDQIVKYGIFTIKRIELKIQFSSDGLCPSCCSIANVEIHHVVKETRGLRRTLYECSQCGELFFSYIDPSRCIVGLSALFSKRKRGTSTMRIEHEVTDIVEDQGLSKLFETTENKEKKNIVQKCINCDLSTFSRGHYICKLVDNFSTEIIIKEDSTACTSWMQKTEEHRKRDISALAHYFACRRQAEEYDKRSMMGNVPMLPSNIP